MEATIETFTLEHAFGNRYLFQVSEFGVGITFSELITNTYTRHSHRHNRFQGHFTREEARMQWKAILLNGGWYHKK